MNNIVSNKGTLTSRIMHNTYTELYALYFKEEIEHLNKANLLYFYAYTTLCED